MPKPIDEIQPLSGSFDDVALAMVTPANAIKAQQRILHALYAGPLEIGDLSLDCAVLEDGTRVLSERGVHKAFGSKRGGSHWQRVKANPGGAELPSFLSANNLSAYVSNELRSALISPIKYTTAHGGAVANGIKADLLTDICGVYLKARRKDDLHATQKKFADQAEILMEAFAKVGIDALVDEATGYQKDRAHNALRLLLNKYIAEGLRKWLQTFPNTFFSELDRLYGNEPNGHARPQYYGKFINKYVYNPIEHGYVKAELDRLNITDEGKRRAKFHQWLSDEGRTILTLQIGRVLALMEMSPNIEKFKAAAKKQKDVSIAPYLFDEMNNILE